MLKSPFFYGLAGGLLLWTAYPPLGWWLLAWIAPAIWVRLVRAEQLTGRHPYGQLYAAGVVHWLLMTQWVRLPHWSAGLGWLVLSAYLASYLPAFIWLARVLRHRLGMSVVFAAPLVWCGLELLRGYLFTGFSLELLGHSQVDQLHVIQVAAVCGGYGVSFVVMLVAACLARAWPVQAHRVTWWPVAVAVGVLAATISFGHWQLWWFDRLEPAAAAARVALIQGSRDTTFSYQDDPAKTLAEYFVLTQQALQQSASWDLIVWPESMYTITWLEMSEPAQIPADLGDAASLRDWRDADRNRLEWMASQFQTPMLLGCPTLSLGPHPERRYNSALWVRSDGTVAGRYDKMHPVMFGEYVPLGNIFPWLYQLTPIGMGLTPGEQPLCVRAGQHCFSPCICFENTVPHLLRRQLRVLHAQGHQVDALLTITNDGWFWGSSLLDVHLTCGVFRAIELRRPMLIAANTGFSALIDPLGRVVEKGPRRDRAVVTAEVSQLDLPHSIYYRVGDWPAAACLLVCGWAAVVECVGSWRKRRTASCDVTSA